MSDDKQLPNLGELHRRYEEVLNDMLGAPPPQSAAETEQYERAVWYCDLHEVLFKWVHGGARPT